MLYLLCLCLVACQIPDEERADDSADLTDCPMDQVEPVVVEPSDDDADGDGLTVADGDCDDNDPMIPGICIRYRLGSCYAPEHKVVFWGRWYFPGCDCRGIQTYRSIMDDSDPTEACKREAEAIQSTLAEGNDIMAFDTLPRAGDPEPYEPAYPHVSSWKTVASQVTIDENGDVSVIAAKCQVYISPFALGPWDDEDE